MDEQRLRKIENVTANFFFWQGLRWVPLGVALLLWAVPVRFLISEDVRSVVIAGILIAALAISARMGTYYSRTYGNVRTIAERTERRERWKWFFVYPLMMLSLIADGLWKPPLLLSGPVWAIGILLYWNSTGRGRLHYLAIAAIIAATGVLPLVGVPNGKAAINLFFGVIGGAYVIGGLLDHLELTRIMRPLLEDGDATAV